MITLWLWHLRQPLAEPAQTHCSPCSLPPIMTLFRDSGAQTQPRDLAIIPCINYVPPRDDCSSTGAHCQALCLLFMAGCKASGSGRDGEDQGEERKRAATGGWGPIRPESTALSVFPLCRFQSMSVSDATSQPNATNRLSYIQEKSVQWMFFSMTMIWWISRHIMCCFTIWIFIKLTYNCMTRGKIYCLPSAGF